MTTIDTPAGIQAWVWTSRMHQLAFEINTGMSAPGTRGQSILAAMYREKLIDQRIRGTRENKLMVLTEMVRLTREANPSWKPGPTILRAIGEA